VAQSAAPAAPQPLTEAQSKDVKDRLDAAVAARSKALKDSFEATRATLSAELTALGAVAAATSAPQSDGKKPSKPVAKPADAKARPTSAAKNTVVAGKPDGTHTQIDSNTDWRLCVCLCSSLLDHTSTQLTLPPQKLSGRSRLQLSLTNSQP